MRKETLWEIHVRENPGHSARYLERFEELRADGADLHGEARLIDAMVGRNSRVLDAGCGQGRVGGELANRGHDVVGVDLDRELIAAAVRDHPGAAWHVRDLARLDLSGEGLARPFDVVVCAGNVMAFLAPGTAGEVLVRFRKHLSASGRVVLGFGNDRGYGWDTFLGMPSRPASPWTRRSPPGICGPGRRTAGSSWQCCRLALARLISRFAPLAPGVCS